MEAFYLTAQKGRKPQPMTTVKLNSKNAMVFQCSKTGTVTILTEPPIMEIQIPITMLAEITLPVQNHNQ